jgi:ribosomal protein S18 acetylase RimI-like enzyme
MQGVTLTAQFHEITTLNDPYFPAFMDIYQESFPLSEQMRFSWWLALLRKKEADPDAGGRLLVLIEEEVVVAMAYYEEGDADAPAYLWYLATRPDARGKGTGARLYQEILARVEGAGSPALLFEVETPAEAALLSVEAADFARRRIEWYRRLGAKLLGGIHYEQSVGWQPALEMHIMVHAFQEVDPGSAFACAKAVLGEEIQEIGELTLS